MICRWMFRSMLLVAGLTARAEDLPAPGSPEPAIRLVPPGAGDADPQALPAEGPDAGKRRARCLKKEPAVEQVVRAAWEEAGLLPDDDRARAGRVRVAGWLPKISAGISQSIGDRWDYQYEPGSPRVDQLQQDDGLRWDAGLDWDLSRTVFQAEELSVAREASRRSRERMDLATEIVRIYFERQRLLLHGMPAPKSQAAVQLAEATAVLDAWTAGRFAGSWCQVAP